MPAIIGTNTFTVSVQTAAGEPLEAQLVRLTIEMLTMDIGVTRLDPTPQGQGRYVGAGNLLSMIGEWRVRVLVRRMDVEDVELEVVVSVGG